MALSDGLTNPPCTRLHVPSDIAHYALVLHVQGYSGTFEVYHESYRAFYPLYESAG